MKFSVIGSASASLPAPARNLLICRGVREDSLLWIVLEIGVGDDGASVGVICGF